MVIVRFEEKSCKVFLGTFILNSQNLSSGRKRKNVSQYLEDVFVR